MKSAVRVNPVRLICLAGALLVGTLLAGVPNGQAQATTNLAREGWYADPEVHVFAGEYWIYPTTSKPGPTRAAAQPSGPAQQLNPLQQRLRTGPGGPLSPAYLLQTSLDAFSSTDLVHWTRHPDVLKVTEVSWAAYAMWAPSVMERDGKYYLFFGANDVQKHSAFAGGIGLAVSDQPGGPFRDLLGRPLIGSFEHGAQPIDPMVFRDDDGSTYLYYGGQGHCNVARLSADLTQVVPMADGTLYREITPKGYVEGPFMLKRGGMYYLMWSEGNWTDASYGVVYARGTSPLGPFQPMGKILTTDPAIALGPGHHSVLQLPGTDRWYIVYHRHPLGTTDGNERTLAIDAMHFDTEGRIEPVRMTSEGVGPVPLPR